MKIISEQDYKEIKEELVDDGMNYCNTCNTFFIVRNSNDGDINRCICPCCGVYKEDNIEEVRTI